jgi:hypothetical protein
MYMQLRDALCGCDLQQLRIWVSELPDLFRNSRGLHKCSQLQRQRCVGNWLGTSLHLHLRPRLHRQQLRRMRDQLSGLPELYSDLLHQLCQLQWERGLGDRNPRIWLYMHLRHRVCRNHLQCLRFWLLRLPDVHASSMHECRGLQRQRSVRDWESSCRVFVHLCYWVYWFRLQHLRLGLSELPDLFPDSWCVH